jgi:hypothetical protein
LIVFTIDDKLRSCATMTQDRQQNVHDILVFALLVAIGVAGRWGQPLWAFTPTAAAAIFAGFYFSRVSIAAMVPLAILGISDLILPAYNSIPVLLVTYAFMIAPIWFGRILRSENRVAARALKLAICGLVPATLFFIASNFAVWAFQSDYEISFAGLMQCYVAAVPFYRWMLAGDIFYVAVFLACWMAANASLRKPETSRVLALHRVNDSER